MLPKPYYQREGITIYHGDCLTILPRLIEAGVKVDAVVTDPPYGISHPCDFSARGRGNLAKCNDYDDVRFDDVPFDPSPILSLNLPTVLWGGNWFADKLPATGGWLVWDKMRPDSLDQATCELAWTNFIKGIRRFRHLWNGMMKHSERGESYHPTQKPVALYEWIFSLPWFGAQIVLDPYIGSGPCPVACIRTGRKCIGIELEEKYCAIAAKRCEAEFERTSLIDNVPVYEQKDLI